MRALRRHRTRSGWGVRTPVDAGWRKRWGVTLACALFVPLLAPVGASSEPVARSTVPVPSVDGPVVGGLRGMWGESVIDPQLLGYVEEEFILSGTATSIGGSLLVPSVRPAAPGTKAPFTTRIVVRRPIDPRRFNGSVLVEWMNVTAQMETGYGWPTSHSLLARKGFVSVDVSAQKQGVDGSPTSLKFYDPVRYGELTHPGDEYSYDIFSQAIQALRRNGSAGSVDPMGGLRLRRVLATGMSQSCNGLKRYINELATKSRMVDGFAPLVCAATDVRTDVAPTFWLNSESESATVSQPDGGLLRYWEVAGGSHGTWWIMSWIGHVVARDNTGVATSWDEREVGQYGERGGGPCPQNFFPDRYAYDAVFSHLDRWVRTGRKPPTAPRFERDRAGKVIRDQHGNVKGGLRLPPIVVPVATYAGDRCRLLGQTTPFDPVTLAQLYPTHEHYVAEMQAATNAAVAKGYLLPEAATDLMRRTRASNIGDPLTP